MNKISKKTRKYQKKDQKQIAFKRIKSIINLQRKKYHQDILKFPINKRITKD
jgi:hypothetical protein